MKNRCIVWMMMTVAIVSVPFFTFSQVKQVFKVIDFDTRLPVADAKTTLFGQTLTTNAQGIAVANLSADKKGAFLPLEQWEKEGYTFTGRVPSSFGCDFQTSDTIQYYMVETSTYVKVLDDQTLTLFRYWYNDAVMEYINSMRDSIQKNPDETMSLVGSMIEAVMEVNMPVRWRRLDAADIIKYYMPEYEKPVFAEVLKVLRSGDVDSAVAMVRKHIDTTDNSRANLEWIDLYRDLKTLNLGVVDDGLISDFSVYLYKNHFSSNEVVDYIQDLNRDGRFEMADSIIRLEKVNNRNPLYQNVFEPSVLQFMLGEKKDLAKLKAVAENRLHISKSVYEKYPYYNTLGDLFWTQKNMYFVYSELDDSVSATHAIDSALAYQNKKLAYYQDSKYKYNQVLISDYQRILDMFNDYPAYIPKQTVYELYDAVYNASKENYDNDTSSLFLKLQLAENALLWLQNAPQNEESGAKRMEVVKQLNEILTDLSGEFPEMYTLENVQISSQLLANCLVQGCDNEKMQDAFRRYEQSFDAVNAVFPDFSNEIFLRFNNVLESYMTSGQLFALTEELDRFNNRLLNIKAGGDPQKLLVLRAERATAVAESLYNDHAYDDAVVYYQQANELYQQAIQQDEQQWIPFLNNYLQMGDAHLNQNQFDKAVMNYQKVLDFEPQIPVYILPQYMTLKGSVYYYVGDIYKSMGETARAEKAYKTAEKHFKKAVFLGDGDAYLTLGEMYWSKAVMAAQEKNMNKCRQMVEQSVAYYEKSPMERPLQTYERVKMIMGDFYKEEDDVQNYYRTVADLTDFYRKFVDYDEEYPLKLLQNAETMLNSGMVDKEEALQYSRDILVGLMYLDEQGRDVKLGYLRGAFNMARAYSASDSIPQAIDLYRDCILASEVIYADTDLSTHKGNLVEIYSKLADCYEKMAEDIDTAHSELWYYRAIDTRDTLIDLMKEINTDGDVNMTYRIAMQYKNNGAVLYQVDMVPSSLEYFDKSNELLLMLYNSEYKEEVEEDVVKNYYFKGIIYEESNNNEKAVLNLRKAVEYGDKSEIVSPIYFEALNELIKLLGLDKEANAEEIEKLTKRVKEVAKKSR